MRDWNLADCLEIITEIRPNAPALVQEQELITWRAFDGRAQSIAAWLTGVGLSAGAKVAVYCYNHVAYLESAYACMKAGFVPVNINYQYKEKELIYLLENSDAEVVVVHEAFLEILCGVLPTLPSIKALLVVGDSGELPEHIPSARYTDVIGKPQSFHNEARSGSDLVFMYTGGTTGMPKGVMWRQRELFQTLAGGPDVSPAKDEEEYRQAIAGNDHPVRALVLPPLMHGTAFFGSLVALLQGGTVILSSPKPGCNAEEICGLIEAHQPTAMSLVGDTFARPILEELRSAEYDISSLQLIASSGSPWSHAVKAGLLEFNRHMKLYDGLGSSEAHNIGTSVTGIENVDDPIPRFLFGKETLLVDEAMNALEIAPGVKGMIAVSGARPQGYYKDASKSATTFVRIDDRDCTLSGDWAIVNDDGKTFTLLGRGSICINTGGEKVFPEEVETALRRHAAVKDAAVIGVPDDRWGQAVVALISLIHTSNQAPDDLQAFVREQLANYKVPKRIFTVPAITRSPAGKADYKWALEVALQEMG